MKHIREKVGMFYKADAWELERRNSMESASDVPLAQSLLCVRSLRGVSGFLPFSSFFPKENRTEQSLLEGPQHGPCSASAHTRLHVTSFCRAFSSLSFKEYAFTSSFSRLASIFFSHEEHSGLSRSKAENLDEKRPITYVETDIRMDHWEELSKRKV